MFKKIIIWTLLIALTATATIGGTMAYLADTDSDINVMTLGNVKINQIEQRWNEDKTALADFRDGKALYPYVGEFGWETTAGFTRAAGTTSDAYRRFTMENVVDKYVTVKNIGKSDAYVRTVFAFEMGDYGYEEFRNKVVGISRNAHDGDEFDFPGTWVWEFCETPYQITTEGGLTTNYMIAMATHLSALNPDVETIPSLLQVYMNKACGNEDVERLDGNGSNAYEIMAVSQGVQVEGFENSGSAFHSEGGYTTAAIVALETAFGSITPENVQKWFGALTIEVQSDEEEADAPATAKSMIAQLKSLPDGTDIKAAVMRIVFGKKADYSSIVNGEYESSEADGVTAYYVPDGEKYVVYMLSDSKIYAPVDSTGLFRDMTALTEVDLSNLDMSQVVSAKYMFRECNNLTTIGDTSGWDTSSMTSARGMFYNCRKLENLNVENWDVSNIEDAGWMFYNCEVVNELDVSDWDTSNFNFTKSMFYNCTKVTELEVENWDMSDVTDTSYMFSYCTTLGDIDFSKWDVSNVQYFNNMFKHARAMTTLDLSTWDTSSAVDMNHMFANCGQLKYLDISGFDTSSVTTMGWMFYEIEAEKIYVGSKWSLESIANLDEGVYSHKIATAPLTGGQGTTCRQIMDLDSKCVAENGNRFNATARYMIPDGGTANPGLLTRK